MKLKALLSIVLSALLIFGTVPAAFAGNTYFATFYLEGGEINGDYGPIEYSLEEDDPIWLPPDPEMDGFTFVGWDPMPDEFMPGYDVNYYACWEPDNVPEEFAVTFYLEGGNIDGDYGPIFDLLFEGDPIYPPADPVREGFIFLGWDPQVDDYMPGYDVYYTALWEEDSLPLCSVTFCLEGGEINGDYGPIVDLYYEGDPICEPQYPMREGYIFLGWGTQPNDSVPAMLESTMPACDLIYYALWVPMTYTASFNPDGGTIFGYMENETVVYDLIEGEAIYPPPDPERFGFIFLGWDPQVDDYMPGYDVYYTALWEEEYFPMQFSVTYYLEGGNIDGDEGPITELYFEGEPINAPNDPVRDGYLFTGWSPEIDDNMPSCDVEYYATWESAAPINIRRHSLSLNGDIGVNFYAEIPNATSGAYAQFSVNGETVTAPIDLNNYYNDNGVTLYKFTCRVAASMIDTPISGMIFNGDDASNPFTYSVQDYLTEAQTAMAGNASFMALASALATYGYYANELFGTNPAFVQHALFDDSQFNRAHAAYLAAFGAAITNTSEGVNYLGSSLLLRTETAIKHYFTLPAGKTLDDFTFLLGEGSDAVELTPVANGASFYVEIADIASARLGTPYLVTVIDGNGNIVNSWHYCAISYVYKAISQYEAGASSVSDDLANVMKALFLYYEAANYYFPPANG